MKYIKSECINGSFIYIYKDSAGNFVRGPKPDREVLSKNLEKQSNKLQGIPKKDAGKPRMDLVRPEFIEDMAKVLTYGAEKYEEPRGELPNYLKQNFSYSKLLSSLERHLLAWKSGVDNDEETGESHLAHAAANLMMLHTLALTKNPKDDRLNIRKL